MLLAVVGALLAVVGIGTAGVGMVVLARSDPGWSFTRERWIGLGTYFGGVGLLAAGMAITLGGAP